MDVRVVEEPIDRLAEYAEVPIGFLVERALVVAAAGLDGLSLTEEVVASPWWKDYDALEGEGPTRWPHRFDVSRWGVLAAYDELGRAGGAVVAYDTPDVWRLEGRRDLAVLWDLRVRPDLRRRGVGASLFAAAESWATVRGCVALTVETQNVNVGACRFYARQGCELRAVDRFAYPALPDEVQLIWTKALRPG